MTILKNGPFKGLRQNGYKAIYADPAWTYATRSAKGKDRSPEKHYECMSLEEIKALPVPDLAAKDAILFMWTIDTHLPQALEVIKAWGFEYKTVGFYWAKENKDGTDFTGMGHWTRANPEQCMLGGPLDNQCLLASQGSPKRIAKNVRRLIRSQRREHSRKPDEAIERIESLVAGPYVELFARQSRPGWSSWGKQTTLFDDPVRKAFKPDIAALLDGEAMPAVSTKYRDDIRNFL